MIFDLTMSSSHLPTMQKKGHYIIIHLHDMTTPRVFLGQKTMRRFASILHPIVNNCICIRKFEFCSPFDLKSGILIGFPGRMVKCNLGFVQCPSGVDVFLGHKTMRRFAFILHPIVVTAFTVALSVIVVIGDALLGVIWIAG